MTRFVAELGNCNGSRQWGTEAIQRCVANGWAAVKLQIYTPATLTTRDAPTYGNNLNEPATQWEHFQTHLSMADVEHLVTVAQHEGIPIFASVFDPTLIPLLGDYFNEWKIASADITYQRLIEAAAKTGDRIHLSTGAATLEEYRRALEWIATASPHSGQHEVIPYACTLVYPCPLSAADVARVESLKGPDGFHVAGYSDHTEGVWALETAATVGADWVEKHVTITPGDGGDHDFAVEPEVLTGLRSGQRWEVVYGSPVWRVLPLEEQAKVGARRSLVTTRAVGRGERFRDSDLMALRPGTGVEPWVVDDVKATPVGKKASRDLPAGHVLGFGDFGLVSASLTVE